MRHWIVIAALGAAACAPTQLGEYKPRVRQYKMPVSLEAQDGNQTEGSLWSKGSQVNFVFADQRAMRLGDIVTVRVEEFADAKRGANTTLDRQSEYAAEIQGFLGLLKRLQALDPNIAPSKLVGAKPSQKFAGRGDTGRTESVKATVPVTVKQVLPNGNLFVEGHRVILVNNEEHHFYVSGVARPQDIDQANMISSTRLADVEVEFTGRGVVTEQQRQGWLGQFFQWIWPF